MNLRPMELSNEDDFRLANLLVRVMSSLTGNDGIRATLEVLGRKLDCEAVELWFSDEGEAKVRCAYRSRAPNFECDSVDIAAASVVHGDIIASMLDLPFTAGAFHRQGDVAAISFNADGRRSLLAVIRAKQPPEVVSRFLHFFAERLAAVANGDRTDHALREAKHRVHLVRKIAYAILHPSGGTPLREALSATAALFDDLTVGYVVTTDIERLAVVDVAGVNAQLFQSATFDIKGAREYAQAIRAKRIIAVTDTESDEIEDELRLLCRRAETRAFVNVPIGVSENVFGMVFFASARPREWSDFEVESLLEAAELVLVAAQATRQETVRRETEESLRLQRDMFTRILEVAPTAILVVEEGKVIVFNRECERISGYTAAEVLGRDVEDLPFVDADEMRHLRELYEGKHHQIPRYLQMEWRSRSGEVRRISWHLGIPTKADDGRAVIVASGLDMTLTEKLREDLEQSRRIASLGRLSATVAHEFNNVMMSILPFTEVIRRAAPENPKIQNAATHMTRAIDRGRRVTQDLLRFTRPGEPAFRSFDGAQWLREFANESRAILPDNVSLTVDVSSEPVIVYADPLQLGQVFNNLVTNARDAMPNGGKISLSVNRLDRGRAGTARYPQDEGVLFRVVDTGSGIPSEIRDTIFEPLFTTKKNGTGLGLAIARQIVATHRGSLLVDSESGHGTTFTILLPPETGEVTRPAAPQ